MLIKFVNDNYYIRKGGNFEKVKGMPISISDYELELFLHRSEKGLAISEAKSGAKISANHRNKKSAIKFVERIIEKRGEKIIQTQIKKVIGSKMLSPRYRFIVNPSR